MTIHFTHTKRITAEEIRNARVLELYGLWDSHRVDGQPPRAGGLLPEAYALCKDDLMLLQRDADGGFAYRHFGANVVAECGHDMSGKRLSDYAEPLRGFLARWYKTALDGRAAVYTVHRSEQLNKNVSWERLLLPLDGGDGRINQVLVFNKPLMMRLELLAGVIDTSHCGVMALEAVRNARGSTIDFRVILANPQAAELLDHAREGLIGRRLSSAFPAAREAGLFHSFVAIADGSQPLDVQFQLGARWLRISAARTGTGVTLTLSDVTSLKQQYEELQQKTQELEREITLRNEAEFELVRLATIDALTGLPNRRHFLDRAERELNRAARTNAPTTLIYLDVDHFKSVNDGHGHAAGDAVLKSVAAALNDAVRPYDLVGRLGGEEFAVLLPSTNTADAMRVAERIRSTVAARITQTQAGVNLQVTISGGAATAREGEALEALIARGDAALYDAKRGGRDQIRQAA